MAQFVCQLVLLSFMCGCAVCLCACERSKDRLMAVDGVINPSVS